MAVRTRLFVISAVIAFCMWAIWPPRDAIKLGLDLNGGAHLVLRVQTEDALARHTRAAADRLRDHLAQAGVAVTAVVPVPPDGFRVDGAGNPAALRAAAAATLDPGFERVRQGDSHLFRLTRDAARELSRDIVARAVRIVERRVNGLGVAEAVVTRYTAHDRILVELPGVADVEHAKEVIKSTAQLHLTLVERGPFTDPSAARAAYGGALPAELEVLAGPAAGSGGATYYVVQASPVVSGTDLRDARETVDEFNRPAVGFTLKADAAERFGTFTARHVNRSLATVLNGQIVSLATIISRIDADGQITGLSRQEMQEQVITLQSGALPADMEFVEERTVEASLGDESVRDGLVASLGGLLFVSMFLLLYYRRAGVNAVLSMILNLLILLALVALVPVTMTLPGIAGLVLTIGMGVDSNVLIFERIREELRHARTMAGAVRAAFDRVWLTIVDTHITSLIAAALLFQFGTGTIRGFATTLTIGLMANVFTAVFASRTLFEVALRRRTRAAALAALEGGGHTARLPRVDFTRWGLPAALISSLVLAAGAVSLVTKGVPLGIDFSGGTLLMAEFDDPTVTADALRTALAPLPGEEVVQQYGPEHEQRFLIRLPFDASARGDGTLEQGVGRVTDALERAQLPAFREVGRELVDAAVGSDLQKRGVYATVASLAAITAYIGARFRFSFAAGALAATVHDVAVTVSCLALAGYDLTLHVVAALLTVIGYSVNDTIVIFDRVRENVRNLPGASIADVVNQSVHQTLGRTVITAGLTFLATAALYLFGGEPLGGFAFTLLAGIVSGTWSTVFIASAMAAWLERRRHAPGRAVGVGRAGAVG